MEKSNELRELFLGSMPKSKKHWPLAICFALSFVAMLVCCAGGSWLAVPFGGSALALSKRMEKKGVNIEE